MKAYTQFIVALLLIFGLIEATAQGKKIEVKFENCSSFEDFDIKLSDNLFVGDTIIFIMGSTCGNEYEINYEINDDIKPQGIVENNGTIIVKKEGQVLFFLNIDGIYKRRPIVISSRNEVRKDNTIIISDVPSNPLYASLYLDSIWRVNKNLYNKLYISDLEYDEVFANENLKTVYYGTNIGYIEYIDESSLHKPVASDEATSQASTSSNLGFFSPSGGVSSFINPTYFADGLARFAIDRFKSELTLAYLSEFKDSLEKHVELHTIFPGVWATLKSDDLLNYMVLLPMLRENAWQDINNFPVNFKELLLDKYELNSSKDSSFVENYQLLLSSCDLIHGLRMADPFSDLLESIAAENYIDNKQSIYANLIRSMAIFSRNLHCNTNSPSLTGWAPKQDIEAMLSSDDAFNIFMTIILTREKNNLNSINLVRAPVENATDTLTLYEFLNRDGKFVQKFRSLFNYTTRIENIMQVLKSESTSDSIKNQQYIKIILLFNEMILEYHELLELPSDKTKKINNTIRLAAEMDQALRVRQYGVALARVLQMLDLIVSPDSIKPWNSGLRKYGKFLVALVEADDAEGIKVAIDAAALPVQSYRHKRESRMFSFGVNLYPGLAVGMEKSSVTQDEMAVADGFLLAPTVPLGLSIDFGFKFGSLSLFVPLIDVGAVAAFRLQDEISALPELNWSSIIAPGAFLNYGFRDSPLYLGVGVQNGPALREVTSSGVSLDSNYRFALNIGIDVPVFQKNVKVVRNNNHLKNRTAED